MRAAHEARIAFVSAQGPAKDRRGSIFRLIVSAVLMNSEGLAFPTWGDRNTANREVRGGELALERQVSQVIGDMCFLWLPIEDEAGPKSRRRPGSLLSPLSIVLPQTTASTIAGYRFQPC